MTYVLAVKHLGGVALLADMGVSWGGSAPVDVALKTASFDGCIYGIAGVADEARSFFEDFRRGRPPCSPADNWAALVWALENRVSSTPRDKFELLLSTRHEGEPQIFRYDSVSRAISPAGDLASIGAGCKVLDAYVQPWFQRFSRLLPRIGPTNWQTLYAIFLTQFSLSQDYDLRTRLRRAGVAGPFHVLAQDATAEYRQRPSVYLLSEYDVRKDELTHEYYKLARFDTFLVVTDPTRHGNIICEDPHADPRLRFDGVQFSEAEKTAFEGGDFDTFAFGFLTPNLFDRAFVHGRAGGEPTPVRTSDLWMSPEIRRTMEQAVGLPAGRLGGPLNPLPPSRDRARKEQRKNLKSD